MTTLCTFSQVAQLRAALPTDEENVTLQYTPIRGEHFARLDCGRVSVLAEPIRGLLASPRATQPKRWTLPRTELDAALAALERSSPITVGDEGGALVLTAGGQTFRFALDDEDTRPITPVETSPAFPPLTRAGGYTPPSPAFTVIDAALHRSGATNGVPILRHVPSLAAYEIEVTPALRYQVSLSEWRATVVTVITGDQEQTTRYPKLSSTEFSRLFLVWQP